MSSPTSSSVAEAAAKRKEKLTRLNRMRAELEARERENPELAAAFTGLRVSSASHATDAVVKGDTLKYYVSDPTGVSSVRHEVDIQGKFYKIEEIIMTKVKTFLPSHHFRI